MSTPSDISISSFEEMERLLNGENAMLLGCTREMLDPRFETWLRLNRPICAIVIIPEPVLSSPQTWFLAGTTIVAFSQWGLQ